MNRNKFTEAKMSKVKKEIKRDKYALFGLIKMQNMYK